MNFLALFKLPIVRHAVAAVLILGIGFYFGNIAFQKKLDKANDKIDIAEQETHNLSGKYSQLIEAHKALIIRTDTLQSTIIKLASKEHIKVDNHISDTKVKRGGKIDFRPNTQAAMFKSDSMPKRRRWQRRKKN